MRAQPFRVGNQAGGRTNVTKGCWRCLEHGRALHEIEHRQARREARRTRCGKHVVGTADIVADGFGCRCPKEDRACVPDARRKALGIRRAQLQVLRRKAICDVGGFIEAAHLDDRAVTRPAFPCNTGARDLLQEAVNGLHDSATKGGAVGDENALGFLVMFSLGEEIGCDPVGFVGFIGNDEDLRGPGDGVNANVTENLALGLCNPCIAGTDDLVHGTDRGCGTPRARLQALRPQGPADS